MRKILTILRLKSVCRYANFYAVYDIFNFLLKNIMTNKNSICVVVLVFMFLQCMQKGEIFRHPSFTLVALEWSHFRRAGVVGK